MSKKPIFNNTFKKTLDFNVKISQVPPMDLAFQTMALSEYELLVATIYKLNELIEVNNTYTNLIDDILEWVVGDGLESVVKEILIQWKDNGSLEELVNETLFTSKLDVNVFDSFVNDVFTLFTNQTNITLEEKVDKDDYNPTVKYRVMGLTSAETLDMSKQTRVEKLNNGLLRVATFNIHNEETIYRNGIKHNWHIDNVKDVIRKLGVHLWGYQEGYESDFRPIESILLHDDYQHIEKINIWNDTYPGKTYTQGIISSLPLMTKRSGYHESVDVHRRGWNNVKINLKGKIVSVYNLHINYRTQSIQISQFEEIYQEVLNDTSDGIIIMGDFNVNNDNPVDVQTIYGKLISYGFQGVVKGEYPTNDDNRSIDEILYYNMTKKDGGKFETDTSDHYPIWAELEVNS